MSRGCGIPTRRRGLYALVAVSVVGCGVAWWATSLGTGITNDSVHYIDSARNLLAGRGFYVTVNGSAEPLTQWPPLFPLLIAFVSLLGVDAFAAARILNVFLFGANAFLAGLAARRLTHDAEWPSLVTAAIMVASVSMMNVHTMAWSEPLFIALCLATLILLSWFLDTSRLALLIAAAATAASATLARYPGAALIGACLIALAFFADRGKKRRDLAVFAFSSIAPLAIWLVRVALVSGNVAGRPLSYHPGGMLAIHWALETTSLWVLPGRVPLVVRSAVTAAAFAGVVIASLFPARAADTPGVASPACVEPRRQRRALALFFLYVLSYAALLGVTSTFLDAAMAADSRICAPLYAMCLIPAVVAVKGLADALSGRRAAHVAVFVVLAAFVAFNVGRGYRWASVVRQDGRGYAARIWRDSPLMKRIKALDPGVEIHTNVVSAIYTQTGRPAIALPRRINMFTGHANGDYVGEVAALRDRLKSGAILVYFTTEHRRWFSPTLEELAPSLNAVPVAEEPDGYIYKAAGQTAIPAPAGTGHE